MEKINDIQYKQYRLEKLIEIWKPYLYKMASQYTINQDLKNDLVQEGNIVLWKSINEFDATKGATYYTYCAINIKFAMLNYLNKKNTTPATIYIPVTEKDNFNISTISMDASTDDYQAISETIANEMEEDIDESKIVALSAHMGKLKKSYRDVILVKYLQGYSDTEIAEMSGFSKQWTGVIVKKAIKLLQKEFGVPQVGLVCKKHTKISRKERELRALHHVN